MRWLGIYGATALVRGFFVSTGRFRARSKSPGALTAPQQDRRSLGRVVHRGLEIQVADT